MTSRTVMPTSPVTLLPLKLVMVVLVWMTSQVTGFPSGAPYYTCGSMLPSHPAREQVYSPTIFPYLIRLSPAQAMPGQWVTVTVSAKDPANIFRGLLVTAVDNTNKGVSGFFTAPGNSLKVIDCIYSGNKVANSGLTHSERMNAVSKQFKWQVPSHAVMGSRYKIRVTVVENVFVYWVGVNTTLTVGPPIRVIPPDATSFNTGSAPSNTGFTSRNNGGGRGGAPQTPFIEGQGAGSGTARFPSWTIGWRQARRLQPAFAPRFPANTNLVSGHTTRGRTNTFTGDSNQSKVQNAGMARWLEAWFGA